VDSGAGTTIEIGELSGTALSHLRGGPTSGRVFTYRIGGRNTDAIFAGTISEQIATAVSNYVKTGSGTWTLTGTARYNGLTLIEEGTLRLTGNLDAAGTMEIRAGGTLQLAGGIVGSDAINVAAGATVLGNGTIEGDLNNAGTVTCGTGALVIQGDVVNDGTMRLTGGAAIQCAGTFVNNGVLDLLTGAQGLPAKLENNGVVIDSTSLRSVKVGRSGQTTTVTVHSYSGHNYQLQRSNSLISPDWGNVGALVAGTGGVIALSDTASSGAQLFYRIAVSP
jgi:autotransporter-associated beta strand protein